MFLIVLTAIFFAGQEHKKVIRVTLSLHNKQVPCNVCGVATFKNRNFEINKGNSHY